MVIGTLAYDARYIFMLQERVSAGDMYPVTYLVQYPDH